MPKPKGITVTLYVKTQRGTDAFNHPVFTETAVSVDNVLVRPIGEGGGEEILDTIDLNSKRAAYILAIPKGDSHSWENSRVSFFGEDWRVIGKPTEGIESMIPLQWNRKVMVESYAAESSD